jgi:hypothetical protein
MGALKRKPKKRSIERAKHRVLAAIKPIPATREQGQRLCFIYERLAFMRLEDGTVLHITEVEREYAHGPFPDHVRLAIEVSATVYGCLVAVAPD